MTRIRRSRSSRPPLGIIKAVIVLWASAGGMAAADTQVIVDDSLDRHVRDTYTAGLDTVRERRFLRVLTSNNSFDYYIYQGRHAGYQYEMVRAFTEYLNEKYRPEKTDPPIQFELMPVRSDQLIPMLLAGYGDMIAARMTITPERSQQVRFSIPYRRVDELIVTHLGAPDLRFIHDLSGRSIAVRRSSSYFESLLQESRRLEAKGSEPIRIVLVDESLETEDILALVAEGHFDYTVADSIVAETAVSIYDDLRIITGFKLRENGQLAWAAHPSAGDLLNEMNTFLERYRHGSLLGNVGVRRYFRDHHGLRDRIQDGSSKGLSPYDGYFKKFGEQYGFDWRLLAAVAYQESRFDQSARNRWGATGLFQLKQTTANEPYIDIPEIEGESNAANNVHAGTKYLAWIKQRYFDPIEGMQERDRIRLALAAYNAGPRTLINARRRAEQMGLDRNRWFRNVEIALLAMKRVEPVAYVSEINQRYVSYVMLGVE